jgi:DNA-binding CsgD family transcriptional regulator
VLLERGGDVEILGGLWKDAIAGSGSLAVIRGRPGIGKTALLDVAPSFASADAATVLRARGAELDRTFGFGVVRQLFERRIYDDSDAERPALFRGAAQHATMVLGPSVHEPSGETASQALHGLYWLTANLAGRRPVMLVVDDAHWSDRASLRFLLYLARRLEGLRLLVVVAMRESEPGADQDLLDILHQDASAVISPAPLSYDAVGRILATVLSTMPEPAFVRACHGGTGGNPLLVRELAGQLGREGVSPTADAVAVVGRVAADGIARAVRTRIAALGPIAAATVRGAAVLGDGTTVKDVSALLNHGEPEVRAAVVDLEKLDILRAQPALVFVHPVLRAAAYNDIATVERAALHARAAAYLDSGAADPAHIARHLMFVEPCGSARTASTLLDAGRGATGRGAPDDAILMLRRALAEPPTPELQIGVLTELGRAAALIGDRRAHEHLAAGLRLAADDTQVAEIGLMLAETHVAQGRWVDAVALLEEVHTRLSADAPLVPTVEAMGVVLAAQIVPGPSMFAWRTCAEARIAQFDRGETLDPRLLCGVLSVLQQHFPPISRSEAALEQARSALPGLLARGGGANACLVASLAFGFANLGRLAEGGAVFDAAVAAARRTGATGALRWALGGRAEISYREGRLADAESEAREALATLGEDRGLGDTDGLNPWVCGTVALVLAERGHADEAADIVAAMPDDFWEGRSPHVAVTRRHRAAVRRVRGDVAGALDDLFTIGRRLQGWPNPVVSGWQAPAALLLAARGEHEEAVALARDGLAAAELFGEPISIGIAQVALGVAIRDTAGIEILRQAVATLEATEARLEHARALVELGAALRRAGSRVGAREILREAVDATDRCGARRDSDRAAEEFVAAGGRLRGERRRLRGPDALTAGELRVARLAADGLTNREIAERLYVTQSAVQWHLRHAFRKLNVASRADLGEALKPHTSAKPYGVGASDSKLTPS